MKTTTIKKEMHVKNIIIFTLLAPIAPPVHEWKAIMDEANAKTRKLEEEYEQTCIEGKVMRFINVSMQYREVFGILSKKNDLSRNQIQYEMCVKFERLFHC